MTMAAPPGIPPSVAKLPLEDLQKLTVECLKKLKVGAGVGRGGPAGCWAAPAWAAGSNASSRTAVIANVRAEQKPHTSNRP